MPARLVALDGKIDIPLDKPLVVVGRDRGCNARLDSARVSRLHCCLALVAGEVLVRDLASTNGVWINGQKVVEGTLRPDDILAIAHLRFRFVRNQTPAPGPQAGGPEAGATDPDQACDRPPGALDSSSHTHEAT